MSRRALRKLLVQVAYLVAAAAPSMAVAAAPGGWCAAGALGMLGLHLVVCFGTDLIDRPEPEPVRGSCAGLDLDALARAYAEITEEIPESIVAGRNVADVLRVQLGDLDDATLGRVVLELGQLLGHVSTCEGCPSLTVVDVLAAGLELTALEWQTAGEQP